MIDFLERDNKTFVRARTTDRLGWEKSIAEGEAYSTFLGPAEADPDPFRRYLKAYKAAKQIIEAIVNVPVSVFLHPTESSASATNQILISTQVLEDKRMTFPHRMDVVLGEAAHEAAHILYTDFSQVSYNTRTAIGKLKHTIANIIEDERIEIALGEEHPGYSRFIEKIKDYYFRRLFTDRLPPYEEMDDAVKLFLCFMRMVRYPTHLRAEELEKFSSELTEIQEVLSPYPTTDKEVHTTTEKIYQILNRYYLQEISEEKGEKTDKAEGKSQESKLATDKGQDEESVSAGGEEESEESGNEESKPTSGKGQNEEGATEGKDGKTADEQGEDEGKPATVEEAIEELVKQIAQQISSSLDEGKEVEVSKKLPKDEIMKELLKGNVTLGSKKDTFFINQQGHSATYRNGLSKVKKYAKGLANKLQLSYENREVRTAYLRSGDFDTRRIADAVIGVQNVYQQQHTVKSKPVALGLLIDESGSMWGDKIEQAGECAILFQEALKNVPEVQVFIYGHSADHARALTTEMYVYQEPGHHPKAALGNVRARGCNRDGVAIEQTANRIRQHTKDSCVLFVISDGEPNADDYCGNSAVKHTRQSVEKVEKDNFTVIQIAIEPEVPSEQMFKNFVKLTTLNTLVKEVGQLLKKVLLKMR